MKSRELGFNLEQVTYCLRKWAESQFDDNSICGGVCWIAIIGSRVKGGWRPDSDLDVIVYYEDDTRVLEKEEREYYQTDLSRQIGLQVHLVACQHSNERLKSEVTGHGIKVYESNLKPFVSIED